jgi:hypothetical protein
MPFYNFTTKGGYFQENSLKILSGEEQIDYATAYGGIVDFSRYLVYRSAVIYKLSLLGNKNEVTCGYFAFLVHSV